ncbi:MAG: R3H domain-containing nucleic acid-binding protein [Chloroflexota bacterium]
MSSQEKTLRSAPETERRVTDDLDLLLAVLPQRIREPIQEMADQQDLLEVVMDLGREPEARLPGREVLLGMEPVTDADIEFVVQRIGSFGDDNRAGIERTLHRISAIRNRAGRVVGVTCRVGRAVYGTIGIIRDLVESGKSILMMGRPGVGKTTLLREAARVLADDLRKRVIIVDTSNEIGGDGDIPHPAIGRARRMQVATPTAQHAVMIEAVENHMPEVIVIDEIGTELEAQASRTIAERGVQLVATAHGNTLENLMLNPTLADLIGGIQTVTLGDEEARRRGTQKSVLERKAPPTFDIVIEIQEWNRVAVHDNVAEVVDASLRGQQRAATIRSRDEDGTIHEEHPPLRAPTLMEQQPRRAGPFGMVVESRRDDGFGAARAAFWERQRENAPVLEPAPPPNGGKPARVYPYGVNRSRLESVIRSLHLPVTLTMEPTDADVVLTVKNYYRRKPQPLRDAEASGTPIYVLRGNSGGQIEEGLGRIAQFDMRPSSAATSALQETEDAITRVLEDSMPIELSPQTSYIRRLQHQLAERYNLGSRSLGREPHRRVQLYPREA